jgi:hypothetical protein
MLDKPLDFTLKLLVLIFTMDIIIISVSQDRRKSLRRHCRIGLGHQPLLIPRTVEEDTDHSRLSPHLEAKV